MLRSSFCDYSDAYILVSRTTTVQNTAAAAANNRKNIIIKSYTPLTNCISEVIHKQIMLDNYSKTCGSLWHYYRDKPYLNANGAIAGIADFPDYNNCFV